MTATPTTATSPARSINDCWNKIGVQGDGSCPELVQHVHCRNCPVFTAAAARLLDIEPPPGHLRHWTDLVASPREKAGLGTHPVLVFRVGEEWLALPAPAFQEVAGRRPIHSLPHRFSRAVLGLVNIRGELLACVSLAELLGIGTESSEQSGRGRMIYERLLVVNRGGTRIAFPVSEVYGVIRYRPESLRETPSTLTKAAAIHTRGLLEWETRMVGCLDDAKLFDTLNRSLA